MAFHSAIPCILFMLLALLVPQALSATIPILDSGHSIPALPAAHLHERQSTGSAFGDLCLVQINYMRAQAGVPLIKWDPNTAVLAKTLAQKCNRSPQQGETVGHAISGSPGYIPTSDATLQTLNAWTHEPHTSFNYARIVAKDVTYFGCGWNDNICPGSKWYMHCFFGNWNTVGAPPKVKRRQFEKHSISTRQSGELGINMDDYYPSLLLPINNMRKDAGLLEVKWSHSLVASTHDRGAKCSDFKSLSIGQLVQNQGWSTVLDPNPNFYLLSSAAGWNETKPAPGVYDPTSHEIDQIKITQPQWTSVGCSWSRNCTAADNYILYCELSEMAPTRRAVEEDLAVRQDSDSQFQTAMGYNLGTIRQEAGLEHYKLESSNALATQAQADADKCDGTNDNALSPQAVYRYDEARGQVTEGRMTVIAVDHWLLQKMAASGMPRPDYDVITLQENRKFGCAWSTKCGSIHYLYCNFSE